MKNIFTVVLLSFLLSLSPRVTFASSGCYSWHSCPSTTGSYVCGDTGHCSECPDNQYCSAGQPRVGIVPASPASTPLSPQPNQATSTTRFVPQKRTKTTSCAINGALQDFACTPGAIFNVTAKQICKPGYSKSVRNVSTKIKNQVFKEYGVKSHPTGTYEVDHLISLELGGSNDIANLWPEAANPKPGFHEKDKVENYLHSQVCKGIMNLSQAQEIISTNWLQIYQQAVAK